MTAPPTTAEPPVQVEPLADFLARQRRLAVVTGAGCSTESGIPDYGGPDGCVAGSARVYGVVLARAPRRTASTSRSLFAPGRPS